MYLDHLKNRARQVEKEVGEAQRAQLLEGAGRAAVGVGQEEGDEGVLPEAAWRGAVDER